MVVVHVHLHTTTQLHGLEILSHVNMHHASLMQVNERRVGQA